MWIRSRRSVDCKLTVGFVANKNQRRAGEGSSLNIRNEQHPKLHWFWFKDCSLVRLIHTDIPDKTLYSI